MEEIERSKQTKSRWRLDGDRCLINVDADCPPPLDDKDDDGDGDDDD